jgi:hypothetical protein
VELIEVVGGVEQAGVPIAAQPARVLDDRFDVLGLFLARIGVIEAQVARAAAAARSDCSNPSWLNSAVAKTSQAFSRAAIAIFASPFCGMRSAGS